MQNCTSSKFVGNDNEDNIRREEKASSQYKSNIPPDHDRVQGDKEEPGEEEHRDHDGQLLLGLLAVRRPCEDEEDDRKGDYLGIAEVAVREDDLQMEEVLGSQFKRGLGYASRSRFLRWPNFFNVELNFLDSLHWIFPILESVESEGVVDVVQLIDKRN